MTASKIHILGRSYKKFLLKFIAPDQVPVEFGGTADIALEPLRLDRAVGAAFVAKMKTEGHAGVAKVEEDGGGDGE